METKQEDQAGTRQSLTAEQLQAAIPYLKTILDVTEPISSENQVKDAQRKLRATKRISGLNSNVQGELKKLQELFQPVMDDVSKTEVNQISENMESASKKIRVAQELRPLLRNMIEDPNDINNMGALISKISSNQLVLGSLIDTVQKFQDPKKRAEECIKSADTFLNFAGLFARATPLIQTIPPLHWTCMLLASVPALMGLWYQYRAHRRDPTIKNPFDSKNARLTLIAAVATVVLVPVIVLVAGTVGFYVAGALTALYFGTCAIQALILAGSNMKNLFNLKFYNKDKDGNTVSGEQKKALQTQLLLSIVANLADATFHVIGLVLTVATIAAVSNPFGATITAGTLATIGLVTGIAVAVATGLRKLSESKAKNTKELLNDAENIISQEPTLKEGLKSVKSSGLYARVESMLEGFKNQKIENFNDLAVVSRQIAQKELKKQVGDNVANHFFSVSEVLIEQLKKNNKMGINFEIESKKTAQSTSQKEWTISIKKNNNKEADKISQSVINGDRIQTTIKATVGDEAIFAAMASNAANGKKDLTMSFYGGGIDLKNLNKESARQYTEKILKVLEAAKINNINLTLDKKDEKFLEIIKENRKNFDLGDHFKYYDFLKEKENSSSFRKFIKKFQKSKNKGCVLAEITAEKIAFIDKHLKNAANTSGQKKKNKHKNN